MNKSALPSQRIEKHRRVAHFAPEKSLYNILSLNQQNPEYHCFDAFPNVYGFAKDKIRQLDLCISTEFFKENRFDLIIHNHVLEHLPCRFQDIVTSMNAALAPDGIHAFTIPVKKGYLQEDLSASLSPDERITRFAQADHMRIFGTMDSEILFQNLFARNTVVARISDFLTEELANCYGVTRAFKNDIAGTISGSSVFFFKNGTPSSRATKL